jgi:phosphopantetheine adenylyltransferase
MCKIYNTIGSLTTIKSQLDRNNIDDFKSVKELIDFQKTYNFKRQEIISYHTNLITQEKELLLIELQVLEAAIDSQKREATERLSKEISKLQEELNLLKESHSRNFLKSMRNKFKEWSYKKKLKNKEHNFDHEVQNSISTVNSSYVASKNRYQFISSQFVEAVRQSSFQEISALAHKKGIVDGLNNFIYGAIGEQQVVKSLQDLPDDHYLVNDFSLSFSPAIYNQQDNDYIKSVQIDHIVVSPAGVFVIETKNWSEKSLKRESLRSPVQQIRRTSFALFKLLNSEISEALLHLNTHHWGNKKITVRNLIVLTNAKLDEEFQYVKVLTLKDLSGYIKYFKPTFSVSETQRIAEFLIDVNKQKLIQTD